MRLAMPRILTRMPGSKAFQRGCALLVLAVSLGSGVNACELRMGWEPWKPYQYRNEEGDLKGLDIELMKAVTRQMGCDLTLVERPWKRHLRDLREGRVDLAAGADYSERRADYARFSDAYRTETVRLFVRAGEVAHYQLDTLSDVTEGNFRLGISRGYDYGDTFDAIAARPGAAEHIHAARNDLLNYRKLARKRVDGILTDPLVLHARVRGTELEGAFEPYPLAVKQARIHVMFSRASTSEALVQRFNRAMETITQNGAYDRIFNAYVRGSMTPTPAQ